MSERIVFFAALATAAALFAPSSALAESAQPDEREAARVPVNVGLVPYMDVNSHFRQPRNNVSVDGVAGVGTTIEGAAVSGVTGIIRKEVRGLAVAGVFGYVGGDVTGAQIGGVASAARDHVAGVQPSGVLNVAPGEVDGLQLSGVANYAGAIEGAQIGVVNVGGEVKGLQLGVVNVADDLRGAPVGLVNVVRKNGRHEIEMSTSNTAAFSIGTKLGTRYVYSLLGMGLQPVEGRTAWMPTAGIGGSVPVHERAFVGIELLASAVNIGAEFDRRTLLAQLRTVGGYRLLDRLAFFGGPVADLFVSGSGKRLADISYLSTDVTLTHDGSPVDLGLGFVFGMQAL